MRSAWKDYLQNPNTLQANNLNALQISLRILDTACEQFTIRQAEKMDRKNRQAIK